MDDLRSMTRQRKSRRTDGRSTRQKKRGLYDGMKIDFDEEKHEYTVDGVKLPSVSDILAPLSAMRYGDLNPAMLAAAAARGTAVHEACEAIDYGLDPEIDPEIAPYIMAYQSFLRDYDVKWELIERRVCYINPLNDEPTYCGTLDRCGLIDGERAVVDIKTYASMTTESQMAASCQTQLYRLCIADRTADRYILHLRKDGTYRLINLGAFDVSRDFSSVRVSDLCLELYERIKRAKKPKKGKKK